MLDKEIQLRKQIKRRKFFENTGKGMFALILLKIFPLRLFGNKKKSNEVIKVQIHPEAVQRKNRGLKNERF